MSSTTNPKALLPHEMNEIATIFIKILHERGLPRDCEMAHTIAGRILNCYQNGIRESGAIKRLIDFELVAPPDSGAQHYETSKAPPACPGPSVAQVDHNGLDMFQRTFNRVCICRGIPRYGKRADRLSRYLADQAGNGVSDEQSLLKHAMLFEKPDGEQMTTSVGDGNGVVFVDSPQRISIGRLGVPVPRDPAPPSSMGGVAMNEQYGYGVPERKFSTGLPVGATMVSMVVIAAYLLAGSLRDDSGNAPTIVLPKPAVATSK